MSHLFISYAREDREIAERLCSDLSAAGYLPWIDTEKLLPGTNWNLEIRRAIRKSRFVILLLSRHSTTKRGYFQKEVRQALETLDEFPDSTIFLIPVRLEPCTVGHPRLAEIQWVDLFPSYEEGFRKIAMALRADQHAETNMAKHIEAPRKRKLSRYAYGAATVLVSVQALLNVYIGASGRVAPPPQTNMGPAPQNSDEILSSNKSTSVENLSLDCSEGSFRECLEAFESLARVMYSRPLENLVRERECRILERAENMRRTGFILTCGANHES